MERESLMIPRCQELRAGNVDQELECQEVRQGAHP